jgi:drug/metabolite transporter (DMT)-like permease
MEVLKEMITNQKLKGSLYVLGGTISYGILATIVKYANNLGISTSVLTFLQFLTGYLFLLVYVRFQNKGQRTVEKPSSKVQFRLMFFGISMGLTSILYYLSLQYISVSIGIILLMQSIWMGIVLEIILDKGKFKASKIVGGLVVIIGTLLATNVFFDTVHLAVEGILLGLAAAVSYTISLYASSRVEGKLPNYIRSKYLILGGLICVVVFWNLSIWSDFTSLSILKWGIVLGIFGTILPPLLFTKGFPLTGIGLGSIIAAIEIPVSILSAYLILGEQLVVMQWLGVAIIILSVFLVNQQASK